MLKNNAKRRLYARTCASLLVGTGLLLSCNPGFAYSAPGVAASHPALMQSTAAQPIVQAPKDAIELTADTATANKTQVTPLVNADLSVLPNNVVLNGQTPRVNPPLDGLTPKPDDPFTDQKGPGIIYTPVEQNGAPGV